MRVHASTTTARAAHVLPRVGQQADYEAEILSESDVVTIMIGGLGTLSNPVEAPAEATQ